jgi:RNA polymerase sigma-70 factor (ECF subfamily)
MTGHPAAVLPVALTPDALDDGRLTVLFEAHEDRLYRLARRLAASSVDAEDLVQETLLRAATSLRSVPAGLAKEEAWLVRILVNIRRDQWRRTAVRKRAAVMLRADTPASGPNLESALIDKQAVWGALDVLHPRRRAILILHELEGMSGSAIASLLGISAMTVRWNLSMARRDLKRILKPHMGDTR